MWYFIYFKIKNRYRVFPIHPFMLESLFDFGEIHIDSMKQYAEKMVEKTNLFTSISNFKKITVELLSLSQKLVHKDDIVSLRDVKRCIELINWFFNEDFSIPKYMNQTNRAERAIILALILSYYCRYDNKDQRKSYLKNIAKVLNINKKDLKRKIKEGQLDYVDKFTFPSGIAKNDRLVENIWCLIISILNRIPLFLIGNPGASKTLSMRLIIENLRGKNLFKKILN